MDKQEKQFSIMNKDTRFFYGYVYAKNLEEARRKLLVRDTSKNMK